VLSLRRADGRPLRATGRYRMALTDFIASGGDAYPHLPSLPARRVGLTDLQALIAWLRSRPQPVRAPPGERMISIAP